MSYINEFLQLRCAPDIIPLYPTPLKNWSKEVSESMSIVKQIKQLTFQSKGEYVVVDLCAGNALTSIIAAHLLPIKKAIAVDIKPRKEDFSKVRNFEYIVQDITKAEMLELLNYSNIILVSSHPCERATSIVLLYNMLLSQGKNVHLCILPCCKGRQTNKIPSVVSDKLGNYLTWCYDLAITCRGKMRIDTQILSPCNCLVYT